MHIYWLLDSLVIVLAAARMVPWLSLNLHWIGTFYSVPLSCLNWSKRTIGRKLKNEYL